MIIIAQTFHTITLPIVEQLQNFTAPSNFTSGPTDLIKVHSSNVFLTTQPVVARNEGFVWYERRE